MEIGELIGAIVENDLAGVRAALAEEPALAWAREPALGSTPLIFAVHRGFTEIVVALLEAGADPHAREEATGSTALHWAAEAGHPELARMLIERRAELEARDGWFGLNPLGWATVVDWAPSFREDRPATAALLVAAGARHDIFTAVVSGQVGTLRALVDADPGALGRRLGFVYDEMEPLHLAASRGLAEMVQLLVELGAAVTATTAGGLTPLAFASRAADDATATILRAAGAAPDVPCAVLADAASLVSERLHGERPHDGLIFTAAREGRAAALKALLAAGADASASRRVLFGEIPTVATPLHLAAGNGHVAAVAALLEGGADAGARDEALGGTPRAWAEQAGHPDVAALLP